MVFGAGLAIVGLFVIAGQVANTDGNGGARHPAVQLRFPENGTQAVRQAQVGVQLDIGWMAELEIEGKRIPLDQLDNFEPTIGRVDDALGRFVFDPGPGKEFDVFPQGQICVTAYLTRLDSDDRGLESWCFTAA